MILFRQLSIEEEPPLGFNPLVVAIVLIVVTVFVAAGLSFWASGLSAKVVGEKTDCSIAAFKLASGTYDAGTSSISLSLENLKPTPINKLILYVYYPDKTVIEKPLEKGLVVNGKESYQILNIPKDFEKGVIRCPCPNVKIQFIEQNGNLYEI